MKIFFQTKTSKLTNKQAIKKIKMNRNRFFKEKIKLKY